MLMQPHGSDWADSQCQLHSNMHFKCAACLSGVNGTWACGCCQDICLPISMVIMHSRCSSRHPVHSSSSSSSNSR